METLTYTVAGRSIKLDYSLTGSFLIEKIDGLTAADIETGAQRGYGQNGYTLRDMAYGARHINVNFLIVGTSRADLYKKRQLVSQVFNPLLGVGELVYTNDANARDKVPADHNADYGKPHGAGRPMQCGADLQ